MHDPDPARYPASQVFGRSVRAGPHDGIVYDSVRHVGGVNWVSYRPSWVQDVLQARHFRVVVPRPGKVVVDEMHAGN
ncbi:RES family NAD+ phosphorylase [Roseovarius marisflavi]|uniref:RES family NAD+ phosphorylase n=1 Tax=Roseovarius marisflavi TaxID=1054996 RepID=UPI000A009A5E